MSLKQKQIDFEHEFSILVLSASKDGFWSQIQDERGALVWEQQNYSEDREGALDAAERELDDMFETHLDEQGQADDRT